MRILYLGINYWPDETGIAPFATGRCEYLAARGHEVIACVGPPYYPRWRVPEGYRRRPFSSERRNGVTVLRSWAYVPRRLGPLRRILHEGSFVCSSLVRALGCARPDLLFVTSPPLGLALSAIALGRFWRVPYVFHVADLQPDAALDLGMLAQGRLVRALYRLEAAAYRSAAMVSTLTEAMRRRIVAKGVAAEKVALLSDWADPRLFSIAPRDSAGVSAARRRFTVAHFGNMGVKQGLEVVLRAAQLTRDDPGIVYLLVGDGAERPSLQAKAREMGLVNVHLMPLQPHGRFHELLAKSDVCLVTQQRTVADVVFPSKVITLLAAARAVIASVGTGSEVARVVERSQAGIVVAPEDPRALAGAVARLRADPAAAARMGRAGRAYALEHWGRERVLRATAGRIAGVLGAAAAAGFPAVEMESTERSGT
ncbi:MAG TPA: WcaI family glycosyltransferase [Candidatus Binataceae bacterium]|nr:WcaI family glycosyltransferase [Candidatus Binataceae bacterium]